MRRKRELLVANRSHSRCSALLRGAKSYKCTKMSRKNSVTNANHPTQSFSDFKRICEEINGKFWRFCAEFLYRCTVAREAARILRLLALRCIFKLELQNIYIGKESRITVPPKECG